MRQIGIPELLTKCGTFGKMDKCGAVEKVRHIWKNAAYLKKCGALGKMRLT